MIDLTKPIRRKGKEMGLFTVKQCDTIDVFRVKGVTTGIEFNIFGVDVLNEHYENIPEPRRPREWRASVRYDGTLVPDDMIPADNYPAQQVRLIEWPEGAPLPEWPE